MRKFVASALIAGIGTATFAQEPKPAPIATTPVFKAVMGDRLRPASKARDDLKAMQGDWRLASSLGLGKEAEVKELGLGRDGTRIRVEGNRVTINANREPLVLANHLPMTGVESWVVEGNELVCFTRPDGNGVFASYKLNGDALEVRYPHSCVCMRSGVILNFERVKK